MKKLLVTIAWVLCFAVMFSTVGFAAEYIDYSKESEVVTDYAQGSLLVEIVDDGNDSIISDLDEQYDFIEWNLLIAETKSNGRVKSIYQVKVYDNEDIISLCCDVEKEVGVVNAEPDYFMETQSDTYQDVVSQDSTEISLTKTATPWYLESMGYNEFQNYIAENDISLRPITIAVLDSGFTTSNPYIQDNLKEVVVDGNTYYGYNTTSEVIGYNLNDTENHGTGVVGTIISKPIDGRLMGINPYVEILPIKVAPDDMGESEYYETTLLSSIIRGMGIISGDNKIVDVDIVSISIGFYLSQEEGCSTVGQLNILENVIEIATNEKIVVIASAGNSQRSVYDENGVYNDNKIAFPAAYENVIGVMGSGVDDELWENSNFGQAKNRNENDVYGYDLIAPAQHILYHKSGGPEFEVEYADGTSFSSPLVAGVIAYYLALKPENYFDERSYDSIKNELVSLFTEKSYTYTDGYNTYSEMVPTVNLIDVIKAIDSSYSLTKDSVNGITYHFTTNEDESLTLNINCDGDIPDFVSRYNVPWYNENVSDVTSVIISGDSVASVGDYAFSGFYALESVVMPDSVKNIGYCTFSACSSLSVIDISNIEQIEKSAFEVCTSFTDVYLEKIQKLESFSLFIPVTSTASVDFIIKSKNVVIESNTFFDESILLFYCYNNSTSHQFFIENFENILFRLKFLAEINSVEGSTCVVDHERKLIYGLEENLTITNLFSSYVSISGAYNVEYSQMNAIGTGFKINLMLDENDNKVLDTYTLLLFGDCNGDGKVNVSDLTLMDKIIANLVQIDETSAYYLAGDLTGFGDGITNRDNEILEAAVSGLVYLLQIPNEGDYDYEIELDD